MQSLHDIIISQFFEVAESMGISIKKELTDETILLETGMDSLAFAVLVAKLEQELGYDPFVLTDTPVYPKTFKEFIEMYEKYRN